MVKPIYHKRYFVSNSDEYIRNYL